MRINNNDFYIFLLKPQSQRSRIVVIALSRDGAIKDVDVHDTALTTRSLLRSDQSDGPYNGPSQSDGRLVDWHCSHETKR
jgi:hypothetical protein